MIDRRSIRMKLCRILQTEYVALLGQRGIGITTTINAMINENAPFSGMRFISVALPRGMHELEEFKELFLIRLKEAASNIPGESNLANNIAQAMQESAGRTMDFRVRRALDSLGKGTSANYLVIVLHALAEVPEEPLKNLLLILREYHDQMNHRGEAGEKLRFLVAGDERLWHLCYHKMNTISPFNIAQRIFLGGVSIEEIQVIDKSENFQAAVRLRDLTGGVPSLAELAINSLEDSDDLSPFFGHLQNYWSSLPVPSQEILKRLATGLENFPDCIRDYNCPEIPEVDSPWREAFWGGFLRMRHYELAWRSPIHQAFVMAHVHIQRDVSKSTLVKVDLLDRAERLEKALNKTLYSRDWEENIEEALSLAVQTDNVEFASILGMIQSSEKEATIREKVEQLAEKSESNWIKELARQTKQHKKNLGTFLIKITILGTKRSKGNFDVFLCHNPSDKTDVKQVAEKLIEQGILPWLDEWELRPGESWQRALEQQIERINTAAVFVGKNGIGPWQHLEVEAFLGEFVKRSCTVIPILLPDAPNDPELPIFLRGMTWVDFRKQTPDPLKQLIQGIGIRGKGFPN